MGCSFQIWKCVTSTGHKPNKIWADKGSESYNRSIKTWLKRII